MLFSCNWIIKKKFNRHLDLENIFDNQKETAQLSDLGFPFYNENKNRCLNLIAQ